MCRFQGLLLAADGFAYITTMWITVWSTVICCSANLTAAKKKTALKTVLEEMNKWWSELIWSGNNLRSKIKWHPSIQSSFLGKSMTVRTLWEGTIAQPHVIPGVGGGMLLVSHIGQTMTVVPCLVTELKCVQSMPILRFSQYHRQENSEDFALAHNLLARVFDTI